MERRTRTTLESRLLTVIMKSMMPSLSLVIPAYNEAARLGNTLRVILQYLNEHYDKSELIVVDDGSSDATVKIARESFAGSGRVNTRLILNERNCGKGRAVRVGLLAARAPVALFSDADLSTPVTEMPKLVGPLMRGECEVVFGSRALDRSLIGVHQPWRREQGGKVFNEIVRLATGLPFRDTQCGFKAFRMGACRPIIEAATIDRFGFDVELLYVAQLAGLRLRECPVRWDHYDGSKVNVLRDSIRMLDEVRAIRRQARCGVYQEAIRAASGHTTYEQEPQTIDSSLINAGDAGLGGVSFSASGI
jgi:glycosyltransferase involved in cell wall biosynthesis